MSAPVKRGLVKRGDVTIEVLEQGKGPTVVMIPSLGRPAEDFDHLSRSLADAGYLALRPQPRGIGKSNGPMHGLTLHDFSRDVAAVIDAHGGQPAVVAGHAFGNFVDIRFHCDAPCLQREWMAEDARTRKPTRQDTDEVEGVELHALAVRPLRERPTRRSGEDEVEESRERALGLDESAAAERRREYEDDVDEGSVDALGDDEEDS